jgi:hypothetical protein
MNTPPTPKRHNIKFKSPGAQPDGQYASGLVEKQIGAKVAKVVTTFESLEGEMAYVLAVLLGGYDYRTAGYVLRSLRNPKIKQDLLWALLETAPVNSGLPDTFDTLLREYGAVASERNGLVHGKWYTLLEDKRRVFVSRSNEHGLDFFDATEITEAELDQLFERMTALLRLIMDTALPVTQQRMRDAGVLPPVVPPDQPKPRHRVRAPTGKRPRRSPSKK